MGTFVRDLRLALRAILQAPGFALLAVLTLGLGIGANTAIFSVVDAVLLRPLPFPQPQRLIAVRESDRQFPTMSVSFPDYLDWVAGNHSLEAMAAYRGSGAVLTHAGPPAVIPGENATAQYFQVLRVRPLMGRTFTAAEDKVGAPDVIVLAQSLWRERFGSDPHILGRTIELDGKPRTVIGIMPAGFPGLVVGEDAPQYWDPLGARATKDSGMMNRGSHQGLTAVGRLKPGVPLEAARADLSRIAAGLAQQYPKSNTGEGVQVKSYLAHVVRNDGPTTLWILLAAVGLVLLIACANVGNLLLARAATRQKPNAVRAALGASRARLVREHLAESFWLALGGAGLGLLLAELAMRAVPALAPNGLGLTRIALVSLDWRVLTFTAGLAMGTCMVFGLIPALHASQTHLAGALSEGGREASDTTVHGGRLRGWLVASETALALLLLVAAGLLIRSLARLENVNPGFNPHNVLSFEVALPQASYGTAAASLHFFQTASERLAALPGVTAVGTVEPLPFSGNDWEETFTVVGRPAPQPGNEPSANFAMVSGDNLRVLGMQLLRGRAFNAGDSATSPEVIMIDDTFARRYWPGRDPSANALGQQVNLDGKKRTVIGVFGRVLDYGLDASTEMDRLPEMYIPIAQQAFNPGDTHFVLRTATPPLSLRSAATGVIQSLDSNQPVDDMLSMDQRIATSLAMQRLTLWLMGGFAGLALLLAAIGIYGVIGYAVVQRTHEIGIRLALGAAPQGVLGMVLRQALRLTLAGAAAGLLLGLPLGRLAASLLYGVTWHDPSVWVVVPVVLLSVATVAAYLPAHRATRVDPAVALRGE